MKNNFVAVIPELEVDSDHVVSTGLRFFSFFFFLPAMCYVALIS